MGPSSWATVLLGPIIQGLRHVGLKNPMVRLAICWLVMPLVFFSASSGKLGTYILPCFPPLAFLIAVGVPECLRRGDAKGFVIGTWFLVIGAAVCFVALITGLLVVPALSASVALWKWFIVAAGLLLWSLLAYAAIGRKDIYRKLVLFGAAPVLCMLSWHFITQTLVEPRKMPGEFLVANAPQIPRDSILVASNSVASSVCWFCKRSDVLLIGSSGEYEYGLSYEDSRHRRLDVEQLVRLSAQNPGETCVTLITTARLYGQYQPRLPKPVFENVSQGLAFAQFRTIPVDSDASPTP
jgi:4-amino-4-deoxy-L-arabinose transferase